MTNHLRRLLAGFLLFATEFAITLFLGALGVIDAPNYLLRWLVRGSFSDQAQQDLDHIGSLAMMAGVGLIVLGVVLWRAFQFNRRITRKLAGQNDEIRAQRNQIELLAEQARVETEAKLRFFTNFSH